VPEKGGTSRGSYVPGPAYDLAAEEGLKLIWFAGRSVAKLPRAAVVRWFRRDGKSDAAAFASQPMPFPPITERRAWPGAFRAVAYSARRSSSRGPWRTSPACSDAGVSHKNLNEPKADL
jgi:hypothetical protein